VILTRRFRPAASKCPDGSTSTRIPHHFVERGVVQPPPPPPPKASGICCRAQFHPGFSPTQRRSRPQQRVTAQVRQEPLTEGAPSLRSPKYLSNRKRGTRWSTPYSSVSRWRLSFRVDWVCFPSNSPRPGPARILWRPIPIPTPLHAFARHVVKAIPVWPQNSPPDRVGLARRHQRVGLIGNGFRGATPFLKAKPTTRSTYLYSKRLPTTTHL